MDSFVLLAYASLEAPRTILQQLLACLNFTLDSEDLLCCQNLLSHPSLSYKEPSMLGEFDSRKDSHSTKFKQKLSFRAKY